MLTKNSFGRGAAIGALVTSSIGMIGWLGVQNEAIARRDALLREYVFESAQQREALEARVAYLEAALAGVVADAEFEGPPETRTDVELRAQQEQLTALAATVARHGELLILLSERHTDRDNR